MSRTKLDKIFDNKFHESRFEDNISNMDFKLDPVYDDYIEIEDTFDEEMLYNEIYELISNSKYKEFNLLSENEKFIKLNKNQINEIYKFILDNVTNTTDTILIWTILSDYFDIYPNKFYNALSNTYKNDIINKLNNKYKIFEKLNIDKLF